MDNIILGNRYKLKNLIGVGGMAKVYKATDRLLQRDVAIKILKDQYAEDDEFVKKFSNEAMSAARLTHVNIVSVYDIGEDLIEGKKIHYIVMEYVDGETLKDKIDREKNLSNHDIVDYSIQIAQALNQAHSSNIIHRDIKPQNILMDKYGLLKVTDFGIARVSTNATITYTSSILGTVHYISPEQAKGKFVDAKSDLYSLGVVMYEMATGKVPFDADNSVGIAVMHIQDDPESPIKLNENLSPRLNDIIMKLLQKDPQERFKNANELIRALEDDSYDIGYFNKDDTAKIQKVDDEIDKTTFIPVVEDKNKKIKKNKIKKEKPVEQEAVYVTPSDDSDKTKYNKKKKRKIWPFILLFAVVFAGAFYFIKSNDSNMVQVPTVLNLSEDEAVKLLEEKHLKANVSRYAQSNNYEDGKVMEQDPSPKTKVKKNTTVNLVISQGREVKVPDLSGMTLEQAEEKLKEFDLALGRTNTQYSDSVEKDKIIEQDPRKNEEVQAGSEVDVIVSLGEKDETKNVTIPYFVGNYEEDAISIARENSLVVNKIDYEYSDEYKKGVVMSQSIPQGTQVAEQTSIDFVVSNGKDPNKDDSEDDEKENNSKPVNVKFTVKGPTDKNSFNVKVYKLDENNQQTDLLYNENHTKDELDANGNINLDFKSVVGTRVNILIDDKSQGVFEVNR